MRIATWNVNSIGARLPRLLDWLETRTPDAVALQETKCSDATRCGKIVVTSVYVPNGRSLGDPQFAYKLSWLDALRDRLGEGTAEHQVVMGDFNVARTDDDVFDIGAFANSTHVTSEERGALEAVIATGLVDVRARPGKNDRPFTYWDYRAGMFHKDLGMRIDYVLASPTLTIDDAYVDREARKGKLPSDHAPVIVDLSV